LRSLGDPRPRLAARTDDSHAAPRGRPPSAACKRRRGRPRRLVRCPGYCRIKPHAPPFQQAPANLFRSPALRLLPRRGALRKRGRPAAGTHRWRYGLPECQILIDAHTFVARRPAGVAGRRGLGGHARPPWISPLGHANHRPPSRCLHAGPPVCRTPPGCSQAPRAAQPRFTPSYDRQCSLGDVLPQLLAHL